MNSQTMLMNDSGRYAGILMHPTSFSGPYGIGDLGTGAYDFIDFLEKSGQKIWQVLPLGQTGYGDSPYQSFSSFAGQPLIISFDNLIELGLLTKEDFKDLPDWEPRKIDYGPVIEYKYSKLKKAYINFKANHNEELYKEFQTFCQEEAIWLKDYSLFMTLKDINEGLSWFEWPENLRFANESLKNQLAIQHSDKMNYYNFLQFLFFRQWLAVKQYANNKGIIIIGDIPIFVAPDSADIWANKSLFQLDSKGFPTDVAGVPPDYFSVTGQLWGNPLYAWEEHKKDNYAWWINRIKGQLTMCDYLRIDHFRGFESYWAVPYGEETAMKGEWRKGPGSDLFHAIYKALGDNIPIIAEDLGLITDEVIKLRDDFNLPGMKVLQFAFDSDEVNNFLPFTYTSNCICYTGTHDNDTTRGWYEKASEFSRGLVRRFMNTDGENISWDFIRTAFSSVAKCAVIPIQDVLSLNTEARMNIPGTPADNWDWRIKQDDLNDEVAKELRDITKLYGR